MYYRNSPTSEMEEFLEYGTHSQLETLMKLADYFKVSLDYLLCRSNHRLMVLTEQENRLLEAYQALDPDSRFILLGDALKELRTKNGLIED